MMRLKCITCDALARPVYLSAARSPHIVDVEMLSRGLHIHPNNLRTRLQAQIDANEGQGYQALLLAYGLCGQAAAGLVARSIPLVIPRAHDCITLFLGSRARYQDQFENYSGTYWYTQDYIERDDGSGTALGASDASLNLSATYEEYVQKYGQDNADYLMKVMGAWQSHYRRAAYIDLGISDGSAVEEQARLEANQRGWSFERLAGDIVLIRRLLEGDWETGNDFLIVPPGQQIEMTYDENIVGHRSNPAS